MQFENLQSPFWELLPNKGLGPIRFSMSKSEVQNYDSEIGITTQQKSESLAQKKKDIEEVFKQFAEFFTEENLKMAIDALQIVGEEQDDVITEYRESGILLTYKAERLTEIFAVVSVKQLHFQGIPIFSDDPLSLVLHMSKIFKETPLIKGDELIFPNHNLYLFSFVKEKSNGECIVGDKQNRTIMWRNSPQPFGVTLSEYRPIKLFR